MSEEPSARIPFDDAFVIFLRHLGYPEELFGEMRRSIGHPGAGLVWLSDHPLTVFEEGGELSVERGDLESILGKVRPIEWASRDDPDARVPLPSRKIRGDERKR